jgi:DNA-binding CsgD family transcriptional regulator
VPHASACTLGEVELLERHTQLAELEAALRDAGGGRGSLALVTGEAGAGKTSLVERFADDRAEMRVLFGRCDDLLIPRPFAPFRDMFLHQSRMTGEGELGAVAAFLDAVLAELDRPPHPTVAVVEDAHWADAATLDAIRFLGRRVGRMRALLIVTYRDDEVPAGHPLRSALAAVPAPDIRRVRLPPLSQDAVAHLADRTDVAELYELTGGNPFYVHEVLAAPETRVPLTVQDAVMARVGRLNPQGRDCVEIASAVPGAAERWLIEGCGVSAGIDEAVRFGVLRTEGEAVAFSHELARRAVEYSLASARRRELNQRVLDVLTDHQGDPARLTHHAVRAADTSAVIRFAPVAARRAASLDSHREAADHFEQALLHGGAYPDAEFADLLDDYARECYFAGRHERAESALRRTADMHAGRGDLERLGASLCLLSDVQWFLGHGEAAESSAMRAIAALEQLPPGSVLAKAYAQRAKLAMVDGLGGEAIGWGNKAIDLARRLDDKDVLAEALDTVGCVQWAETPYDNRLLVESLELAVEAGLAPAAGRAYHNLADGYVSFMRYDVAGRYLEKGLAFCEAHDLITSSNNLLALRALWHLEQGHWAEAEQDLQRALGSEDVSRITALAVQGLLQTRRGDPRANATLEETLRLAELTSSMQNLLVIAATRAELAWLQADPDLVTTTAALEQAIRTGPSTWVSKAQFWLYRVGAITETPPDLLEPYALQLAGRWNEAAEHWSKLGRPYEQADALAQAPRPEPLLRALAILDRLGAAPLACKVRKRLVEMGVASVPRGPRAATRESPAGLTARQTEVLALLAEGLTYQEIARRLSVSIKTVDHHVAAVRYKLDVTTRADAVTAGRRLGILPKKMGQGKG